MKDKLEQIKEKALSEHIPIIMDDTLDAISDIIEKNKPYNILEIGTATRIFCNMFFKIYKSWWIYRYNRTRYRKNK